MNTSEVEGKIYKIPDSWSDVSYLQALEYTKRISALCHFPSRREFFDSINGEGAYDIYFKNIDTREKGKAFADIGFIIDNNGQPQLNFPTQMRLPDFTITIKEPLDITPGPQLNDVQAFYISMTNLTELEKAEALPELCALYCQPLINPDYSREEALKLIPLIQTAPVEDVTNLVTFLTLRCTEILIQALNNQLNGLKKPNTWQSELEKRKN